MTNDFDHIDAQLIAELRRNCRERINVIAQRIAVPPSTVYDRLVKLKKLGVRFTSIVDWTYLGCSLTVCFIAPYSEALAQHPNVNACVRVSPDALFIECVFATMLEVERFQALVPGAKLYPVVETLKKEGFVPEQPEKPTAL